jgi:O-antigen ligase
MILPYIYLIYLLLAPQLWIKPLISLPADYILYPSWIIILFFKGGFSQNKITVQDKFLIAFIVWIAISLSVNGDLLITNRDMGLIIVYYGKLLLLFFLLSFSLKSFANIKSFIIFFVLISLVLSIEGIQHKFTGIGWAGQSLGWIDQSAKEAGEAGRTRWIGIFDGPGVFCVVYTIALPFLLAGTRKIYGYWTRILCIFSIPLIAIAIYFNGSRGGFLTALSILLMHFGQNFKKAKIQLVLGVLLSIGIFISAPMYMTQVNDSEKSAYHRIEMWSEGYEMVIQNPVFGVGRGNFRNYTSKLVAHNSAIEIMGETGLVGLFLWFGIIYMALKSVTAFIKESIDEKDKIFASALFISIIGYLISAMLVTLEYETFYALLALCSVIARDVNINKVEFTKKDFKIILISCFGWCIFVNLFTKFYFMMYS